jgi:aspartyl-tRNA(Asn)/glutamyl-tRNA(Gln) amidotransferase subunit A
VATAFDELLTAPMAQQLDALRRRQISPVELAQGYMERVGRDRLKAFITLPGNNAIREARAADTALGRGERKLLSGVPIAIKDLFATGGLRTTGGSRILRDWIPKRDAVVVDRLRSAGAVIFGKTNLHEFAYGVTTANPWWGIARNPRDPQRSPGGSSGGSAIAVVAGLASAALGSDTGGSIRIPAALCGCVGLKPTYGAIPLDGAIPLGWSLDHPGPLTRTVDDAGLLFDVLTETTTWQSAKRRGHDAFQGMRAGIVSGALVKPTRPVILTQIDKLARALTSQGLDVVTIEIPELEWTVATQLVTLRAEASAVHARWLRTRPRAYGPDVRVRLQLGALVSASDYVLAQRMRQRIRAALERAFTGADVLVLPTTPITAPIVGERLVRWRGKEEPVDGALVRLTAPFNLTGVPALSVPFGDDGGLPIGVQVVGRWNDEARVLSVGRLIEGLSR